MTRDPAARLMLINRTGAVRVASTDATQTLHINKELYHQACDVLCNLVTDVS